MPDLLSFMIVAHDKHQKTFLCQNWAVVTIIRDDLLLEIVLSDKKRLSLCKLVSRVFWVVSSVFWMDARMLLSGCLGLLGGYQGIAWWFVGCFGWLPGCCKAVTRVFWVVTEELLDGF